MRADPFRQSEKPLFSLVVRVRHMLSSSCNIDSQLVKEKQPGTARFGRPKTAPMRAIRRPFTQPFRIVGNVIFIFKSSI
jgi:hypothetical protein